MSKELVYGRMLLELAQEQFVNALNRPGVPHQYKHELNLVTNALQHQLIRLERINVPSNS